MPTVRGLGLLGAGGALLVAGRVFGLAELLYIGTASLVAVILASLAVAIGRAQVAVSRQVSPPRAHAGEQVHVSLEVINRAPVPTSMLEVVDRVQGLPRPAVFTSPSIPAGRRGRASYALTCRARGIYRVGPITVAIADPFGLARLQRRIDLVADLAVYPPVVPLSALPPARGHDMGTRTDRPSLQVPEGEEFYTLREYQVGDDLRKVHWRSTARRGRLMLRQEELPWHARGTVVLDVRRGALGASGGRDFEAAVTAAASAVQYFAHRGEFCRYLSTDGVELPFGVGLDHYLAILDRLAVVDDSSTDRLVGTLARLRRHAGAGGGLVFCGGALGDDEARRLAALRSRFSPIVVVRPGSPIAMEGTRDQRTDAVLRRSGTMVVRAGDDLSSSWNAVVGAARRAHGHGAVAAAQAGVRGPS